VNHYTGQNQKMMMVCRLYINFEKISNILWLYDAPDKIITVNDTIFDVNKVEDYADWLLSHYKIK